MGLKDIYRLPGAKMPVEGVSITVNFSDGSKEVLNYTPIDFGIRYGTNPHQRAAVLLPDTVGFRMKQVRKGQKDPSITNIGDAFWAAQTLKYIEDPAAVVMKHDNSSGAAYADELSLAFVRAWYGDWIAGFGGVVGLNKSVDTETAELIAESNDQGKAKRYLEVVAAPEFEEGVIDILSRRPGLRVFKYEGLDKLPKFRGDDSAPVLRTLGGACDLLTVEDQWLTTYTKFSDLPLGYPGQEGTGIVTTQKTLSERTQKDMYLAMIVAANLKSNGVAIANDGCVLSPGTGQQDRIRAVDQAIKRAKDLRSEARAQGIERYADFRLEGSVLASDGFFPFRDSVDKCHEANITAIIQPGGSERDSEVVSAANEHDITMIFTGERSFRH